MARNYLSFLPQKFMRVVAGFYKGGGQYFVRRGDVSVPRSLQRMVWKDLDDWKDRFQRHNEGSASSYRTGGVDESDMAAQGFVKLLLQIRDVFLQDSAIIIRKHPDHIMWTHPVFQHPDWAPFASLVQLAEANIEEPRDVQLQKAIPLMAEKMAGIQEHLGCKIEALGNTAAIQNKKVLEHLSLLTEKVMDLAEGRIPLYFSPNRAAPLVSATPGASMPPIPFSLAPRPPPDIADLGNSDGPMYVMCSKVVTLHQLWREWHDGLANKPSVQSLESKYGSKWRSSFNSAQKMWYSRRKFLIEEIKRRAGENDVDISLNELEAFREQEKMSLNALHNHLRDAQRKPNKRKRVEAIY